MFDGARSEILGGAVLESTTATKGFTPKIFTMRGIFLPRAEVRPGARKGKKIEARVPGIRVEVRPEAAQERQAERARRARERAEARRREEEYARRQRQAMLSAIEYDQMQMEEVRKKLAAAAAALGVVGAFAGMGMIYLGFQSILASLEGLVVAVPAVLLEGLRGLLMVLASGDPTLTAATALVGLSLLVAARNAIVSAGKAHAQRREYGY